MALPRATTHRPLVGLVPRAQSKHQKHQSTRRLFNHWRKQRHYLPRHNSPATSRQRYTIGRRQMRLRWLHHRKASDAPPVNFRCVARLIYAHNLRRFTARHNAVTLYKDNPDKKEMLLLSSGIDAARQCRWRSSRGARARFQIALIHFVSST